MRTKNKQIKTLIKSLAAAGSIILFISIQKQKEFWNSLNNVHLH